MLPPSTTARSPTLLVMYVTSSAMGVPSGGVARAVLVRGEEPLALALDDDPGGVDGALGARLGLAGGEDAAPGDQDAGLAVGEAQVDGGAGDAGALEGALERLGQEGPD